MGWIIFKISTPTQSINKYAMNLLNKVSIKKIFLI